MEVCLKEDCVSYEYHVSVRCDECINGSKYEPQPEADRPKQIPDVIGTLINLKKILGWIIFSPIVLLMLLYDLIKLPVIIFFLGPLFMLIGVSEYLRGDNNAIKLSLEMIKDALFMTSEFLNMNKH